MQKRDSFLDRGVTRGEVAVQLFGVRIELAKESLESLSVSWFQFYQLSGHAHGPEIAACRAWRNSSGLWHDRLRGGFHASLADPDQIEFPQDVSQKRLRESAIRIGNKPQADGCATVVAPPRGLSC